MLGLRLTRLLTESAALLLLLNITKSGKTS